VSGLQAEAFARALDVLGWMIVQQPTDRVFGWAPLAGVLKARPGTGMGGGFPGPE
jgi:hypothetical protein